MRLPALLLSRLTALLLVLALATGPALAAFQFSGTIRDNAANSIETTIGTAPILRGYDGTLPASCGAARNGTVVFEITLPSDWVSAASSGSKTLLGTWQDPSANATGTPDYFTIFESTGTTCHIQGTITATGGGGDVTLDNTNIAAGQQVSITSFTITVGGG